MHENMDNSKPDGPIRELHYTHCNRKRLRVYSIAEFDLVETYLNEVTSKYNSENAMIFIK